MRGIRWCLIVCLFLLRRGRIEGKGKEDDGRERGERRVWFHEDGICFRWPSAVLLVMMTMMSVIPPLLSFITVLTERNGKGIRAVKTLAPHSSTAFFHQLRLSIRPSLLSPVNFLSRHHGAQIIAVVRASSAPRVPFSITSGPNIHVSDIYSASTPRSSTDEGTCIHFQGTSEFTAPSASDTSLLSSSCFLSVLRASSRSIPMFLPAVISGSCIP